MKLQNATKKFSYDSLALYTVGITFLVSLCTNVSVTNILSIGSLDLNLFHLIFLFGSSCLLLILLIKKQLSDITFPPFVFSMYIAGIVLISLIMIFAYGFTGHLANILFGFYIMVAICSLSKTLNISIEEWERLFFVIGIIYIMLININMLLNFKTVLDYVIAPHDRIHVFTFSDGGKNLEATWPALFSLFYIKRAKLGYLYFVNSLTLSIIFSSRTALVLNFIVFIFMLYYHRNNKLRVITFIGLMCLYWFIVSRFGIFDFIVDRFLGGVESIGVEDGAAVEPGMRGRFSMWGYFSILMGKNLAGYGAGNAVPMMRSMGGEIPEQAVHNIYMQAFLDFGIIGGLYHIALVLYFIYYQLRQRFNNLFGAALILFFVGGIFQFSGVEPQLAILLGIYFSTVSTNNFEVSLNLKKSLFRAKNQHKVKGN